MNIKSTIYKADSAYVEETQFILNKNINIDTPAINI